MRTYNGTHPHITFAHDLAQAPFRIWLLLGEVQAKCQCVSEAPADPELGDYFRHLYLAKGALATTAIEGNSLSEDDVKRRIAGDLSLPPSQEYLGQQIDNVVEAYNLVSRRVLDKNAPPYSIELVNEYNRIVLKDLELEEGVISGEIRDYRVTIGRYLGAPPEDCEYLLGQLCDWINSPLPQVKGFEVAMEILRAIIAHIYIAWIHPYGDGNGRTARLIEFDILFRAGIPDVSAHILSNHYNKTREEYYRQLQTSHSSGGDIFPFIEYALQGFVDGLDEQIQLIQGHQLRIHWRNYVHRQFDNKKSATDIRRRHLLLDLSEKPRRNAPISEIRDISTRTAAEYATRSDRTIQRDIHALERMKLVKIKDGKVQPNIDLLASFLPQSAKLVKPQRNKSPDKKKRE